MTGSGLHYCLNLPVTVLLDYGQETQTACPRRCLSRDAPWKRGTGYFLRCRRPVSFVSVDPTGSRALSPSNPWVLLHAQPPTFGYSGEGSPVEPDYAKSAFRYTRWINTKHTRSGHVFQGRYKAILVEADRYLLELVRYIHLNPVRAGFVKDPADYPWSSHRAYVGREELPWLWTDWVLSYFAKRVHTCRQRYAAFVQEGKGEGHREEFHKGGEDGRVLADDQFLEHVLGLANKPQPKVALAAIIRCIGEHYGVCEEELRGPARTRRLAEVRRLIGWLARHFGAASTQEVATYFHRDASTLSRHLGKIDAGMRGRDG